MLEHRLIPYGTDFIRESCYFLQLHVSVWRTNLKSESENIIF
jgi:hypothetical protein